MRSPSLKNGKLFLTTAVGDSHEGKNEKREKRKKKKKKEKTIYYKGKKKPKERKV